MRPWGLPLLALDCSGRVASVALLDSAGRCHARRAPAGQSQASDLLPMAESLLNEAGVDWQLLSGLVLCHGPGSFTGLRIAAGLAQGLGRSLGLQIACVSGFEALAFADHCRSASQASERPLLVRFDARLGEAYEARVWLDAQGLVSLEATPRLVLSTESFEGMRLLTDPDPETFGPAYSEAPASASLAGWSLRVVHHEWQLGRHHRPSGPFQAQPLYVREKVAQTIAERAQHKALSFEPLEASDLASVMVIENQAYPFPWTSGNFRDALAAGYNGLKLIDQGAMVGYLVWMRVLDEAHLLNFTIAPARQRRGLGQFMLDRWRGLMKAEGMVRILLEVRPSNEPAIRLYRRNGFRQIGLRRDYYPAGDQAREDALVMALEWSEGEKGQGA